jgi:phage-related holin
MGTMGEFIAGIKYYLSSFLYGSASKAIVATTISIFTFAVGDVDVAVKSALLVYVLDFVLWVSIAVYNRNFDLNRFRQWLAKMFLFFVVLAWANQADKIIASMGNRLEWVDYKVIYIKYRVVLYFWIHEFISLTKKLISIWFPLPEWLLSKIMTYKEKLDDTDPHSPKYQRDTKLPDSI